jgi:hypothetical protein
MSNPTPTEEELWDELPTYAFMAAGLRGREQISLRECFIPGCDAKDQSKLHPLKKSIETKTVPNENYYIERVKYLIHCDECQRNFHLVFERSIPKQQSQQPESSNRRIIFEQVLATDDQDKENYGQIGFVQPK